MVDRNFINSIYWDVVYIKWILLVNNFGVNKYIIKVVMINCSYKNLLVIKIDLNFIFVIEVGVIIYFMFY